MVLPQRLQVTLFVLGDGENSKLPLGVSNNMERGDKPWWEISTSAEKADEGGGSCKSPSMNVGGPSTRCCGRVDLTVESCDEDYNNS